jgi:hypothetical protein
LERFDAELHAQLGGRVTGIVVVLGGVLMLRLAEG